MQQHDPIPLVDLWDGAGPFFFSEYGHVAFQIKLNHECSNIVANILPAFPLPLPLTSGQNSTFFRTYCILK